MSSIYDNIEDLIPIQFRESENFNKLLKIFITQFDELVNTSTDIEKLLSIDTAVGKQLDLIGAIIVQHRDGLTDEEYRKALKVKILSNSSSGLTEDIINIVKELTDATKVVCSDMPPASYVVYTNGTNLPENLKDIIDKVTAAGVSVSVAVSNGNTPIVFPYVEQYNYENLLDNFGDIVIDNNAEPIIITSDRINEQKVPIYDNNDVLLLENGVLEIQESFISNNASTSTVNAPALFSGGPLNYVDPDDQSIVYGNARMPYIE